MKSKQIYMAGAITSIGMDEANEWRKHLQTLIGDSAVLVNPVEHIPEIITPKVEKEMFEWDLWKLKHSDLVVCDFDHTDSLGTSWELGLAKEYGIPIIGLNMIPGVQLHPWWCMSAMKICESMDELYEWLCFNFLYD